LISAHTGCNLSRSLTTSKRYNCATKLTMSENETPKCSSRWDLRFGVLFEGIRPGRWYL